MGITKKKLKNETGQGIIEFALVAPIFIILIMFILDCAWVTFQRISFDYAYREAAWEMKLNDYYVSIDSAYPDESDEVRESFLNEMMEKAPQLSRKDIDVGYQSHVYYHTSRVALNAPTAKGGTEQSIENRRYADVHANVTYQIRTLTPIGKMILGDYNTISLRGFKTRLVRSSLAEG